MSLIIYFTEILVDVVDVVLEGSGINEKFLGLTLFALVPNTTEFMNAMSFAMYGNIALRFVSKYLIHGVCVNLFPSPVWKLAQHMLCKSVCYRSPRWLRSLLGMILKRWGPQLIRSRKVLIFNT